MNSATVILKFQMLLSIIVLLMDNLRLVPRMSIFRFIFFIVFILFVNILDLGIDKLKN